MLGERTLRPRTIVVVEDEFLVRDHAVGLLDGLGFPIADFATADEALSYLEAHCADVLAIFTDIRMPGTLDGVDLARAAQERWPWIKIMIASAYLPSAVEGLPPDARFLQKPWLPVEVISVANEWAERPS